MVDENCANVTTARTSHAFPGIVMAPTHEFTNDLFWYAVVKYESSGKIGMRPKGVRIVPAHKSGRVYGILGFHAKFRHVEEGLDHGLALNVTTWSAKRHHQISVFKCDSWIRRKSRALSRTDRRWMVSLHPV